MEAAIISFTSCGIGLSARVAKICELNDCHAHVFTAKKGYGAADGDAVKATPVTGSLREWTGTQFDKREILIFIGACGIAVRSIAPFIRDKSTDPGVIVIDDMGKMVVSLLSGHLGGANFWTRVLAGALCAVPVITTSSDNHGYMALDIFAKKNGLFIDDMDALKRIEAAQLEGADVGMFVDKGARVEGRVPKNFCPNEVHTYNVIISIFDIKGKRSAFGASREAQKGADGRVDLALIPKAASIGVGCVRGKTCGEIGKFIKNMLKEEGIYFESISDIATIDIKKNEDGLIEFAKSCNVPIRFYGADELKDVKGSRAHSDFVLSKTGVDNVCERAALADGEKTLIAEKRTGAGVAAAVAAGKWRITFE